MQSKFLDFQKSAEKLVAAKNISERKFLLKNVADADFLELAKSVKEICYSYWTSQPTKAGISAKVLQTIYKLSPQPEIQAYLEWVSGIAELTRGKLVSAIARLDEAAAIFAKLDKEYDSAQTQVSKLYVLALLGRYNEAIETGDTALKVFRKNGDESAVGKIEKNIGNIYWRRDVYDEAEKRFLIAKKRFEKIGNVQELTMVEHCLATVYTSQNKFQQAEKFYAVALRHAKKAKMFVTEAEIEASLGNLALFRGKFNQALKYLELSRQKYENLAMPHQTAIAELEIADIYLELNLTEEAFLIYEKVSETLHQLKMRGEEARARANFGRAAVLENKLPTARKQLKKAARLCILEKNNVGAATVKIAQARLELNQKNYAPVLPISLEIETLLAHSSNLRAHLAARLIKAEALRHLGENATAEKELTRVLRDSIKYEQPNTAQAAHISLGKIAVAQNAFRRAEKHFQHAIRLIETLRAPLAAEEFRMAFLADKLEPFELLAKFYLAENKLTKAFSMIERARARALSESLNENLAAENVKSTKPLQKKLAIWREELNWFYSRLNRADESEIINLQTEAGKREKQIANVMRQIASTTSNRANSDKTAASESEKLKSLQKTLGERKALIEFVSFDGVFSAFVVTDKKICHFADLARENEILSSLESLQFQFGALRYGTKNLGNFSGELKKRADLHLRKLYEKLFAPLEKAVGDRDLIVVPVGATHYVPFHALFDGEQYLIESREIIHAPSATVWRFLASKPQKKSGSALLIGYADERIPLVEREIESLQKIFRRAESFTGERATLAAFTENAARFDVVHLACHGQFRSENPLFSSLHLADGRLTVRDISSLKIKAELVTLSACETGLNKIFAGEEILGLTRGFLSAGAKSMLLSLWAVSDEATAELMQIFYERRQAGNSSAKALQSAQKSFIERGFHPYYWSPFVLIGK